MVGAYFSVWIAVRSASKPIVLFGAPLALPPQRPAYFGADFSAHCAIANIRAIISPNLRRKRVIAVKTLEHASPGRSYRQDVDGIRAVAILSVVLYHIHAPLLTGGYTGVDIFFVISGYLIGGHIYSELRAGNFSYLRFYQRRAKRILPAFYVVLLFTIAAAACLLSPSEVASLGRFAFAAALSASNLILGHFSGYFAPASALNPLLMTWSLGVEEQFYAVIPLLMGLLVRLRRNWLLPAILILCGLSLLLSIFELTVHPTIVFYMLFTRAWELGAGVALAIAESNRKRTSLGGVAAEVLSAAGVVLTLAPMFLLNANSTFPGLAALPTVVGASLLIATPSSLINRRCLSLGPLVFVGKISYSLYLWHWPILALLRAASGAEVPAGAADVGNCFFLPCSDRVVLLCRAAVQAVNQSARFAAHSLRGRQLARARFVRDHLAWSGIIPLESERRTDSKDGPGAPGLPLSGLKGRIASSEGLLRHGRFSALRCDLGR